MSTEVVGADTLARTLRRASDRLDELPTATRTTGETVRLRAAQLAPKLSGALAGSISAESTGADVVVASALPYAAVQELGWAAHNITAQPFLKPAMEGTQETWMAYYVDDVERVIDDVKGA